MIKKQELIDFINKIFEDYQIFEDKSSNGLQVDNPTDNITGIVFGVDISEYIIDFAIEKNANLIITHHGLIWGGLKYITGQNYRYLNKLIKNDTALFTMHLPLDAHVDIGNNAQFLELLNIKNKHELIQIGKYGTLECSTSRATILQKLNKIFDTELQSHFFGKDLIDTVGVVTGSGINYVDKVFDMNIDLYITGEPSHSKYFYIKENKMNVIYSGHYFSETLGIKSLMKKIDNSFDLNTYFCDNPTGL